MHEISRTKQIATHKTASVAKMAALNERSNFIHLNYCISSSSIDDPSLLFLLLIYSDNSMFWDERTLDHDALLEFNSRRELVGGPGTGGRTYCYFIPGMERG